MITSQSQVLNLISRLILLASGSTEIRGGETGILSIDEDQGYSSSILRQALCYYLTL